MLEYKLHKEGLEYPESFSVEGECTQDLNLKLLEQCHLSYNLREVQACSNILNLGDYSTQVSDSAGAMNGSSGKYRILTAGQIWSKGGAEGPPTTFRHSETLRV